MTSPLYHNQKKLVETLYPEYAHEEAAKVRLIAAAPELLEACQFALERLNEMTTHEFEHGGDKTARERLHSAITKATGTVPSTD